MTTNLVSRSIILGKISEGKNVTGKDANWNFKMHIISLVDNNFTSSNKGAFEVECAWANRNECKGDEKMPNLAILLLYLRNTFDRLTLN